MAQNSLDQILFDDKSFSDLLKDVLAVLGNRNYLFLLIGLFFLSLTIGTHETLGIYMAIYFWELTPYQQGWLAINTLIGYQIAFFTAAHLHGKYDKRWTIVVTAWGLTFFWSLAPNLALLGFSPAAGSWGLVFFIIGIGLLINSFNNYKEEKEDKLNN